jgi:hypothetical protein
MRTKLNTDVEIWDSLQDPDCEVFEEDRETGETDRLVLMDNCVTIPLVSRSGSTGAYRKTHINPQCYRYYAENPWYTQLKDGVQMLVKMEGYKGIYVAKNYDSSEKTVFIVGNTRYFVNSLTPVTKSEIAPFMELAPEDE